MDYWEERVRRRLEVLDDLIGRRNASYVRAFVSYLLANDYSFARCQAYVETLISFGRFVRKDFEAVSRSDVEAFLNYLIEEGYKDWTISSYKARIKRFYKWLLGDDERYPPQVSWIKVSKPRNDLPKEILSEEEVKALANAADNIRDKALVLTLYESGLRAGEFLNLKIKDVQVDKHGAILNVSGKTGDRRVRVISSAPALLEWLNHHPKKNDPNAHLFGREPDYGRMSHNALLKILRKLAERAGIKKHVHPHLLRHSRATHLARYLTESQLAQFFGWVQGSRMPQIYVHLSGRDLDPALLRLAGLEEEAEKSEPKFRPKKCSRCGELNPPNEQYCRKCGLPLDPTKAYLLANDEKFQERLDKVEEKIASLESKISEIAEDFKKLSKIMEIARKMGVLY